MAEEVKFPSMQEIKDKQKEMADNSFDDIGEDSYDDSDASDNESNGSDKAIEIFIPFIEQIPAQRVIRLLQRTVIYFKES